MKHPKHDIEDQAALWVLRCESGLTPAQQDEMADWLAASPLNKESFARLRDTWTTLDRLGGLQESLSACPDPDLLAPAKEDARARGKVLHFPRLRTAMAIAACIALLVGAAFHLRQTGTPDGTTSTAERITTPATPLQTCEIRILPDGTEVTLAPGTTLTLAFAERERRVMLSPGQAFFKVAKNPDRPFIVATGPLNAVAVGTAFNVRVGEREVEVYVSEGRVRMDNPRASGMGPTVAAGGAALGSPDSPLRIRTVDTTDAAMLLSWKPRLIEFDNEPLDLVLGELNRSNHVRLRTDDPALGRLRLTTTLRSDNVPGFLRLVESAFGIIATEHNGDLVLHKPAAR